MVDFIKKINDAIRTIKYRINPYTKIKTIDELNKVYALNYHDLSDLDLREHGDLFYDYDDNKTHPWTNNVIWPTLDKMPANFSPQKLLESSMRPRLIEKLHQSGKTGHGINIAIIDGQIDATNPEYSHQIKLISNSTKIQTSNTSPEHHGPLVACRAVGENTGTAPDANLYYFNVAKNRETNFFDSNIDAFERVLEYQKNAPESERIHILSCSFGLRANTSGQRATTEQIAKVYELIQQLHNLGIQIIHCSPAPTEQNDIEQRAQIEQTLKQQGYQTIHWHDQEFSNRNPNQPIFGRFVKSPDLISIPTRNMSHIDHHQDMRFDPNGGDSSAAPYLAGVFACALQGNTIFCTRENWQDELIEIMKQTASQHPMGGKIINPTGIVERVSQIARTMEMDLIKHQASQHE